MLVALPLALIHTDTGGEVNQSLSGCLLHDALKGRGARLFRRFSPQPAHQLKEIDGGSNRHMTQMGFGKTDIARAPQAHRAHLVNWVKSARILR